MFRVNVKPKKMVIFCEICFCAMKFWDLLREREVSLKLYGPTKNIYNFK